MTQIDRHWGLPYFSPRSPLLPHPVSPPILQWVSLVNFHKPIKLSLRCLPTVKHDFLILSAVNIFVHSTMYTIHEVFLDISHTLGKNIEMTSPFIN